MKKGNATTALDVRRRGDLHMFGRVSVREMNIYRGEVMLHWMWSGEAEGISGCAVDVLVLRVD